MNIGVLVEEDAVHGEDEGAPTPFVGQLRDSDLARLPGLSPHHQARLARSQYHSLLTALACNPSLAPHVQRALLGRDFAVAGLVASNPALTAELQHQVFDDCDDFMAGRLAGNPALVPPLQRAIFARGRHRAELARNHGLLPDLQWELAREHSREVRAGLAGNPNVHPKLLNSLSYSSDPVVQARAARNPRLTATRQADMSLHAHDGARVALASNPGLNRFVQRRLTADPVADVRMALAQNPSLDDEACGRLIDGADDELLKRLAGNSAVDPRRHSVLAERSVEARRMLAWHPRLAADVQRSLAEDPSCRTSSLARNAALVPEVQLRLAHEAAPHARGLLMRNPSLTREALYVLLLQLVHDRQPDTPVRWSLDSVRGLGSGTYWTRDSLDHPVLGPMVAARTGRRSLQLAAASHPDLLVRLGLAGNLRVGAEPLRILLADEDPDVRGGAARQALSALAA